MPHQTSRTNGYDAFISYSQAVSGELATALQAWLERFATPWYRPRSLRIFRDYTSLSASEDLWRTIEQALSSAAHFIVLASPEAAASVWVNREVEWWRTNRSGSDMYIALTGGDLAWDAERNDWDWQRTTSLPPAARGMFSREPLWVDLSSVQTVRELDRSNPVLLNSVAQIAAPLRGVDKDILVGEHITYYRRARRQRRGGVVALSILTVFAVAAAYVARVQANNATNQARVAAARALAAAAQRDAGNDLSLAQLLAVEAYRLNPDAASRSALFQAVTASPALVRYLDAGSTVTGLAGSGNGRSIVAGTQGGQVVRWTIAGFSKLIIARLGQAVTSVSVSADGDTVAAANSQKAIVWASSKSGLLSIAIPAGQTADLTAVSPSGRFVLIYTYKTASAGTSTVHGTLILVDTRTWTASRTNVADPYQSISLAMPSDRQVAILNEFGTWRRRTVPAMALSGSGFAGFGAHDYATALSPDGGLVTSSNGGSVVPIWETRKSSTSSPAPDFQAASAGPEPSAIAISPDGREAVTADNGALYVAPITRSGASVAPARQLGGNSTINPGALAFVGDSAHLVSGSGSLIAFWNLDQLSRIGMQVRANVPASCAACSGSWLSVSPDDKTAVVSGSGPVTTQQLDPPFSGQALPGGGSLAYDGPTAWSPDGRRLYVATSAGIQVRGSSPGLPLLSLWPGPTSPGDYFVKAMSVTGDGKNVVVVGAANLIEIRDAATGQVVREVRGPFGADANPGGMNTGTAAVSGDGTTAAVLTPGRSVDLIDLRSGKASPLRVPIALAVAFGGGYLAILLNAGDVRLWSVAHHDWAPAAGSYISAFSINGSGTMLAEYDLSDSVLLQDPGSGTAIGSLDVASPVVAQPPSLAFTANGTTLVIAVQGNGANFSGELERWNLSPDAWLRTACGTAAVGMTAAQWREVVGTQAPATLACGG